MGSADRHTFLDGEGSPLEPRIQSVLRDLRLRFPKRLPQLDDDVFITETLHRVVARPDRARREPLLPAPRRCRRDRVTPSPAGGQRGTVTVSDATHPLTAGLQSPLSYTDEWYEWDVNPTQDVHTLVTVDESSYPAGTEVGEEGTTHPVTWCQKIEQGRSWYSSLGHHASAYTAADDGGNANDNDADDFVRLQLRKGIAYSAGLLPADCSPPAKDDQGSWSGVTPWPLVPINAALTSDGKVQSFGSVSSGCTDTNPYDFGGNDCVTQGGQMEIDIWDPAVMRTAATAASGLLPNATYTDLFCSMQVQMPHRRSTMTVGGDDGLGGNAPNDSAIGVTSYSTNSGLRNEAPMNYPRWYPTGTTTPDGSVVVQGGALQGGPGGPGVLTPEIYRPNAGSSWKLLTGATSAQAYGDGFNGGPDENRWWYPRAFVAPTNGNIFNISGTQMFELDPSGNGSIADARHPRRRHRQPGRTSATRSAPRRPRRCTAPARSSRSAAARGPTAAAPPAPAPASRSTSAAAPPTRSSPRRSR